MSRRGFVSDGASSDFTPAPPLPVAGVRPPPRLHPPHRGAPEVFAVTVLAVTERADSPPCALGDTAPSRRALPSAIASVGFHSHDPRIVDRRASTTCLACHSTARRKFSSVQNDAARCHNAPLRRNCTPLTVDYKAHCLSGAFGQTRSDGGKRAGAARPA
jgi:hypothetical protein